MPKKTDRKTAKKTKKPRIKKIMDQVKEPLSLLETLKTEGLARGLFLLNAAGEAAKSINREKLAEQFKELLPLLGLVQYKDFAELESRVCELEDKLNEIVPRDDE